MKKEKVKIRPFRYGNLRFLICNIFLKLQLKSDRFGMEISIEIGGII